MKFSRFAWIAPAMLMAWLSTLVVFAQVTDSRHLIVTSGGFSQPQDSFFQALARDAADTNASEIQILVLPVGLSTNPDSITDAERTAQLDGAEQERQELEAGCMAYVPSEVTCKAILVPVITHKDALASPALDEFSSDPDGIFFLQNNGRSILEALSGTELNREIGAASHSGSIISGPADLFSGVTIHGFRPKFGPARAMTFGAILAELSSGSDGMTVSPGQVILDTRPLSENRLGRLLNLVSGPDMPQLGIGIEPNNGFELVSEDRIEGVYGDSIIAILDAETYQSANGVIYQPGTNLIGLRNVLVHLLASGSITYDLNQRQTSLRSSEPGFQRSFDELYLPEGAGTILLSSNLLEEPSSMDVLTHFPNLSGGQSARILIVAIGYSDALTAEQDTAQLRRALEVPTRQIVIPARSDEPLQIDAEITGVILTGPDPALIRPEVLLNLKSSWLSGLPILADRAGAWILGAQIPGSLQPDEGLPTFSPGRFETLTGLGFIQASIEPQALQNFSWERMLTMAYLFPENLAIGIAPGAAIAFTSEGVRVSGANIVSIVDFRNADLAAGTTGTYQVVNGLVDIYTPGEALQPIFADSQAVMIHAPTPELEAALEPAQPTATPSFVAEMVTPVPTEAPKGKPPTRTPRPTSTPVPTPPPSDPGTTNLMVFFGVLAVVVVIVGVWLNRQIAVE